jgi:hypothetical protein
MKGLYATKLRTASIKDEFFYASGWRPATPCQEPFTILELLKEGFMKDLGRMSIYSERFGGASLKWIQACRI